jgi:hypothetical protein
MRRIRRWAAAGAIVCAAGCAHHPVHPQPAARLLLPPSAFPHGVLLQPETGKDIADGLRQVNGGLPGYRAQPAGCQADQDRLDGEVLALSPYLVGEAGIDPRTTTVFQDMVFAAPSDLRIVRAGWLGRCRQVRRIPTRDGWDAGAEYSTQRAIPPGLRADDAVAIVTRTANSAGCGEDKASGYAVTKGSTVQVQVVSDTCTLDLPTFDALFVAAVHRVQSDGAAVPVRPAGQVGPRIYGPPMPSPLPAATTVAPRPVHVAAHPYRHSKRYRR